MSIEEAAPFMIEAPRAAVALDRPELEHLAYHGHSEVVFDHLLHLPEAERRRLHSPGILSAAILGGIEKLRRRWQSRQESPRRELELIERTVADFDSWSEAERRGPREPFLAMLAWSDQLRSMARDPEGLAGYDRLEALGIRRYPDLHGQLLLGRARGLLRLGRVAEAHEVLLALAGRPYLHPDRNAIAEAVFLLGQTALLTGRAIEYHRLLLRGLRMFSTDFGTRRLCVRQLVVARRGFLKALTDPALTAVDRGLFLAHYIESALARSKPLAALGLHALARFSVLAGLYLLNYAVWDGRSARLLDRGLDSTDRPGGNGTAARRVRVRRGILVTRAMGGIGDFLMMTPGLHALRERHPGQEIHLAIPRAFFPVFEANPDVSLMDIENGALDLHAYRRWFNLTDCPAARIESRSVPNVRADRIEIFARALGIRGAGLRRMDRRPRYSLTEAERQLQREFWRGRDLEGRTVIGVQAHAAESYRDYPRMEELVAALAREAAVLVFGQRGLEGFVGGGIVKVADLPLRRCFALAAACDVIVAPDSAFVHFAGACALPCVALYGPIDGRLRTRAYPACTALDAREALRCVPCWRNERIPLQADRETGERLHGEHPGKRGARRGEDAPVRRRGGAAMIGGAEPRCKICGGASREAFRIPAGKLAGHPIPDGPDDCAYYECVGCGFCFTTLLDAADHASVYDEAYWRDQDPDWNGRIDETLRLVLMAAAMRGGAPWEMRILDLGCGMGAFVRTGREKLGLQVWGTDIIEPKFGREFFLRSPPAHDFDLVVACEVIEHLPFPLETLGQTVRSLRPGGILAFQTAYYDRESCGRDWWYVGPANGHVSLFSARSLDVLYQKLGGRARLVWNDYPGVQAWRF